MKRNHFRAVLVVYFIVFVFEGIAFSAPGKRYPWLYKNSSEQR